VKDRNVFRRGAAVAALAVLLAGCGFHLRQPIVLPESMARVQVQGTEPHGELVYELGDALAESGAQVVSAGEPAGAILQVLADRFQSVVASVNEKGRATEYELRYTLTASLREPGGETLVPAKTVLVRKLLAVNPRNALGTSSEQEVLQREMRRDGVRQLLRQLRNELTHRVEQPTPPADEAPR
jgi:LPS-assembly lipoprotein